MLGFLKKSAPPAFDLALYDDDIPCDGVCTRRDVPGYRTFLMERKGATLHSVDEDRLKELGLSEQQAWQAALDATSRVAQGLDDSAAEHVPGLVVIGGSEPNAIPSAIIHWHARPERHGAAGSFVVLVEKHIAIALKVETPGEVGSAFELFVGLLAQHMGSETGAELDGVRVLWKDAIGWELITIRAKNDGLDTECSDRMASLLRASE